MRSLSSCHLPGIRASSGSARRMPLPSDALSIGEVRLGIEGDSEFFLAGDYHFQQMHRVEPESALGERRVGPALADALPRRRDASDDRLHLFEGDRDSHTALAEI